MHVLLFQSKYTTNKDSSFAFPTRLYLLIQNFFIMYKDSLIINNNNNSNNNYSSVCISSTSFSSSETFPGSSMGSLRLLMILYNTGRPTIIFRDVWNFVWSVVDRHWNIVSFFPQCFMCVFEPHYICAVVGFGDQLLVSLDVGDMDTAIIR